jgi:hypothetical protein
MSFVLSPTASRIRETARSRGAHALRGRALDVHSSLGEGIHNEGPGLTRPRLRLVQRGSRPILIAGSDRDRCAKLARELGATMTPGTTLDHAGRTWEMLERAPASRMVMLAGDVDGMSVQALAQLLGRRHPDLPVLTLDQSPAGSTTPTGAPGERGDHNLARAS